MPRRRAAAALLLLATAGCSPAGTMEVSRAALPACAAGMQPGVTTTFFLGRRQTAPLGGVTEPQIRDFLAREVTPRFPGYTLLDGLGSWKGATEQSNLLVIGHCGGPAALTGVDAVTAAYAAAFAQESVGRTDQAVCQNFCAPGS